MKSWDESFDAVIIGSGGGGLAAALAVRNRSLEPVVLEKQAQFGGSTAMSGGVLWLPNNPLLERAGAPDTIEAARSYLDHLIGETGVASSPARRAAFLRESRPMVEFLEAQGLEFYWADGYSDYYDELPGGRGRGRALCARNLRSSKLGELGTKVLQLPGWSLPVQTDEFSALSVASRTVPGKIVALRLALRLLIERLTSSKLFCRGGALQARMLLALKERGVALRAETALRELIVEEGRVTGVRVQHGEEERRIEARHGVLLNAGGFSRNEAMRQKTQPKPASTQWTMANQGDTGEVMTEAIRLGAAVELMDESWWIPVSVRSGRVAGFHSPQELQKPFCIVVDAKGERFVDEGTSYMEFGQAMYRRGAVPCWVVLDARHRRYYPWGAAPPRVTPPQWLASGYMKKADTIEALAGQCGIDAQGLARTVERFNGFARTGLDGDFKRGARVYGRYFGDPTHRPNPSLGAIERAPFYAVALYPGDIGTAGGLVTDEHARVLKTDGTAIPGLYACGNIAAPVFGRYYPGPGASIGASFVFGFIAARHIASRVNENRPQEVIPLPT